MGGPRAPERKWWLDDPSHVRRVFHALIAICVLLVAADALYERHGHLEFEDWPAFHAAFGFAAYVGIVTLAKGLRRLLRRDEDYYDR